MTIRQLRRWSDLGRVERVDLYTRLSLYAVLWITCGRVLVAGLASSTASTGRTTAVLAGGAVVTALGTWVMSAVIGTYPAAGPLPRLRVGALLLAGGGYLVLAGLPATGDLRQAVAVVVAGNIAAALGGVPDRRVSVVLVALGGVLVGLVRGEPAGVAVGAVVAAAVVLSVRVSVWLNGVVAELDGARQAQARLAVAEERLRFSRDVHDVLGRRLSAIAVQAELAATLARRGDDGAGSCMLHVRGIAHDALEEARALARGYRPTNLAQELDGARSLLRSAGIEVQLDVGVVPSAWHEAAGWVVRESVTNVLRHSTARHVRVAYADDELRVENDGVAAARDALGPDDGTGLRELRERLEPLGAGLRTDAEGERWTVVATLPGAGPLSAARASGRAHHSGAAS